MQPEFHLSPEESSLVENSAWLLTKQRIIGKVYGLFGLLSEQYSAMLEGYAGFIPEEVPKVSPKIYKGEMYQQLPYVMLDHPRFFDQKDVFAIRTFFWWGNDFSIHLVLGGVYRNQFIQSLLGHLQEGTLDTWSIGVSDDPWEHHFERDNYVDVHSWRQQKTYSIPGSYIKLGKRMSVAQWREAHSFFISSYKELLECIT